MTRPACFSSESYPAALAATKASGGLLVVDATASWCEPCKTMDQVTWSDARVTDWLLEHATALQVDVVSVGAVFVVHVATVLDEMKFSVDAED